MEGAFIGINRVTVAFYNDRDEIMAVIGIGGPKKRMPRVKVSQQGC